MPIIIYSSCLLSYPLPRIKVENVRLTLPSTQTNVKGLVLAVKALLPTANKAVSAVLALTSQTTAFPTAMGPGMSGYNASKIAQIKVIEYLAAEEPNVFAATVHPGICDTAVLAKSGMKPDQVPLDQSKFQLLILGAWPDLPRCAPSLHLVVALPGDFLVWLASSEGSFLKGRSVSANWDVDELKAQAESIQSGLTMTSGIYGLPYPHTGSA